MNHDYEQWSKMYSNDKGFFTSYETKTKLLPNDTSLLSKILPCFQIKIAPLYRYITCVKFRNTGRLPLSVSSIHDFQGTVYLIMSAKATAVLAELKTLFTLHQCIL